MHVAIELGYWRGKVLADCIIECDVDFPLILPEVKLVAPEFLIERSSGLLAPLTLKHLPTHRACFVLRLHMVPIYNALYQACFADFARTQHYNIKFEV